MQGLYNLEATKKFINNGDVLLLAGDESIMRQLPLGNWIGGTIPYFMSEKGGVTTKNKIFINKLPQINQIEKIRTYAPSELKNIPNDYPYNGVSFIIIPAFSEVHENYAKDVMSYEGIFNSPLIGWVAGIKFDDLINNKPKVYNGLTGEVFDNRCVIMHTSLPEDTYAQVETVNIFDESPDSEIIEFPQNGTKVRDCIINGKLCNLADFISDHNIDIKNPLIGDFMGAKLNVSFRTISKSDKTVKLFAPVFKQIKYKFSNPVKNYSEAFSKQLETIEIEPSFSCNCILNYIHGELQGKSTGKIIGPMTFGEIAYLSLNQTLVYMTYEKKGIIWKNKKAVTT